jgi:hypothetical protein
MYSVLIDYQETGDNGLNDEQLQASIWLHEYIRHTISSKYGRWFPLNRYHVIPLLRNYPGINNTMNILCEALIRTDEEHALDDALSALETLKREGQM